jgi:hypothetical protein
MLIHHKSVIFIMILAAASSSCTVLTQFPDGASTTQASHPAQAAPSAEKNQAGQLAAMHDARKVDMTWVLQYYRLISTVPIKMLSEEYERTKNDFSAEKAARNQWQLAMLLSIPSAPFYDSERAATLFKQLANDDAAQDSVTSDAAFLMYSVINEQTQINKKSAMLEEQLAEAQAANKKLEDQLDALKAIEKNLNQRNKVEVIPKP